MATINPAQDYDIIQTLTFAEASGTCRIRLYRGSSGEYTGTVKIREGTSGAWSDLSVSGTATTFNVTNTTMQVAHDWNKIGSNYMTCSFRGQSTNLTGIAISQKAVLSGAIGDYFMRYYAYNCSNLTSLSVPDTSGITSVGTNFMHYYAQGCSTLTSLDVPDTSGITSVGTNFMRYYAYNCSNLTSLSVPDTSGITSVGDNFMRYYAQSCGTLTTLVLPSVGWFATNDVTWGVPAERLTYLKGEVLDSADLEGWQALTTSTSPNTLYLNYIRNTADVYSSDRVTTISEAIGFQYSLTPTKNISTTLSNTIGQQYNYTYLVFESRYGTASSSIGFQFNLTPTKNINQALSSSAGDRYTLTFDNDFVTSLSNSIGYQSNLEFIHNINYGLSNSIGYQSNLEYSKLEVEGIAYNNLQPYIVVYRYRRIA